MFLYLCLQNVVCSFVTVFSNWHVSLLLFRVTGILLCCCFQQLACCCGTVDIDLHVSALLFTVTGMFLRNILRPCAFVWPVCSDFHCC
jgi:hypothetical protein